MSPSHPCHAHMRVRACACWTLTHMPPPRAPRPPRPRPPTPPPVPHFPPPLLFHACLTCPYPFPPIPTPPPPAHPVPPTHLLLHAVHPCRPRRGIHPVDGRVPYMDQAHQGGHSRGACGRLAPERPAATPSPRPPRAPDPNHQGNALLLLSNPCLPAFPHARTGRCNVATPPCSSSTTEPSTTEPSSMTT